MFRNQQRVLRIVSGVFVAAFAVSACSDPREDAEQKAERAIAKTFGVKPGAVQAVDVDSKTGVIKLEGNDAKYVKGARQGRPSWLPESLPLPEDFVIDVSAEIQTSRLIRSIKGTTKTSVEELRRSYRAAATSADYRIAAETPDSAVPDRQVVLLAYTPSGEPIDVRVSATGDLEIFVGRLWEAPPK